MAERRRMVVRNRRQTLARLILLVFVGLAVLSGIIAAVVLLTSEGKQQAALTALPFTAQTEYAYTGNGFLYATGEGIAYKDLSDSEKDYTAVVTTDQIKLKGSPNAHVLYNAAALKIISGTESIAYAERLVSVACGSGHVAALWQDAGGKESIQVLDLSGTQKDLLVYEGQFVVDYGFHTNKNEYLWVLTLDIESGTPLSTIRIYNMTLGSTSGILQVQNQLVERVYFTNSSIFVAGTNHIIRYALENNRESYHETVYGWDVLDFTTSPAFLLAPRSAQALGIVKVLTMAEGDVSGAAQTIVQVPAGTLGAFLMQDKLVLVTPNKVYYYDYKGKRQAEYTLEVTVSAAAKMDGTTLLLTQQNGGLYLYKVK